MNIASAPQIIAAYVHIPFCTHKCEFCDFAAFSGLAHLEAQYFEVLEQEILARVEELKPRIQLSTIFFGGGTPGLADPERVRRIIELIKGTLSTESELEITLETTPHAITVEKLVQWRSMGINRLSIGIESLNQSELTAIGRDHSKEQALYGLNLALDGGFKNISIDFMYGLPTQTMESWQTTLAEVGELTKAHPEITHVSSYGLALADNSPLYSRFPRTSIEYPNDDSFAQMYFALVETLTSLGFHQYEVSNFAKKGWECKHNHVYWENREYLAFGVGAHRYIDGWRSSNWRSLAKYMRAPLEDEMKEHIDADLRVKEAIMLGLRLRDGIDLEEFANRYNVRLEKVYAKPIEKLLQAGCIQLDSNRLRLSDQAVPISNSVLVEFM